MRLYDNCHYTTTHWPRWEPEMHVESKNIGPWHEQINWSGVLGLAVMAIGSALGWVAIISGLRAIVR